MKLFQALRAKAEARRQAYLKRRQAWIDFFQSDEVKGIALDYFYTRDSRDEPFFPSPSFGRTTAPPCSPIFLAA